MRILHVINTLDPKTGGPPAVATRLAAAQAALGHEVGIVCYADPAADARVASSLSPIPGMSAVTIHKIAPEVGGRGRLVAPNALAWFAANFPRQTLVHIHGAWDRLLLRAARAAARLCVPYVVVPHGMLDPWSISGQGIIKTIKK